MAKAYLNRQDRETIGLTVQLHEGLRKFLETNEKHMPPSERKFLKSSLSFYQKFLEELFKRVGSDEGRKMINNFKGCEVIYKTKNHTAKEIDTIKVDTNAIQDIAEGVLSGHCASCKKTGQAIVDCNIKELFIHCDIPPYDTAAECPFKVRA